MFPFTPSTTKARNPAEKHLIWPWYHTQIFSASEPENLLGTIHPQQCCLPPHSSHPSSFTQATLHSWHIPPSHPVITNIDSTWSYFSIIISEHLDALRESDKIAIIPFHHSRKCFISYLLFGLLQNPASCLMTRTIFLLLQLVVKDLSNQITTVYRLFQHADLWSDFIDNNYFLLRPQLTQCLSLHGVTLKLLRSNSYLIQFFL